MSKVDTGSHHSPPRRCHPHVYAVPWDADAVLTHIRPTQRESGHNLWTHTQTQTPTRAPVANPPQHPRHTSLCRDDNKKPAVLHDANTPTQTRFTSTLTRETCYHISLTRRHAGAPAQPNSRHTSLRRDDRTRRQSRRIQTHNGHTRLMSGLTLSNAVRNHWYTNAHTHAGNRA